MPETQAAQETPNAQRLREAIARDYGALCGNVAALVNQHEGPMRFDQRHERVVEIANEAVRRVLERSEDFDPRQPAIAWLTGFARNVVHEQGRGRRRRPVCESDLDEPVWNAALARLFVPGCAEDDPLLARAREAFRRLAEVDRRVLDLALVQGLDSAAVAREMGFPSAGAARVRRCRALRALRELFFNRAGRVGPKEQTP